MSIPPSARCRSRHGPASSPSSPAPARLRALALAAVLALGACATPIGVDRVSPDEVYEELTRNALTTGEPSGTTLNALRRHNLLERWEDEPEAALGELHRTLTTTGSAPEVFALAELTFLRALDTEDPRDHLAAAIYAYAYLFPELPGERPQELDPTLRVAADLYNWGLTAALASVDDEYVEVSPITVRLPFGEVEISFDPSQLEWAGHRLTRLVPVAELEVRGLRNRYRTAGVGAPLAGDPVPLEGHDGPPGFLADDAKIPVTALLLLESPRRGLVTGKLRGRMEARVAWDGGWTHVGDRWVPLEVEPTSSLAYMLAESSVWEREIQGFLIGDLIEQETRLFGLHPYRPGRIPVVLVHGTASSHARWMEMVNDLVTDPRIAQTYQFWLFTYDTGNPIAYSSMLLREALSEAVTRFDPEGADPALRRMVVIGHSQGGLLTRMTAIDSGDRLWRNVSTVPIEELELTPTTEDLLRRSLFLEPLPFVERLIFVCTPHRGSFVAGWGISQLVGDLVTIHHSLLQVGADLIRAHPDELLIESMENVPSSIDDMTPGNPFLLALEGSPIDPGVRYHSIIAVDGDDPPAEGDDGVVAYRSAHLEGAASELVVRSGHSAQGHPRTIEEVRRILLRHSGRDWERVGAMALQAAAAADGVPSATP